MSNLKRSGKNKHQKQEIFRTASETESEQYQTKKVWAYSEDAQQLILNCHEYFKFKTPSHSIRETCTVLKVSRGTVQRVVIRGKVRKANRKTNEIQKFSKIDSFMKDLIMRAVYEFYDEKIAPTLNMIYEKILQKTSCEDYEFPYGRSTLSKILKSLGFRYCRNKNRQVLMESPCIQAMCYEFLRKLGKFRADGYTIV